MITWRFDCEWDIGCNNSLWLSEELLRRDVAEALEACDIEESIEELFEGGYLNFYTVTVIDE